MKEIKWTTLLISGSNTKQHQPDSGFLSGGSEIRKSPIPTPTPKKPKKTKC